MPTISKSVGAGGANHASDVLLVQHLLNDANAATGQMLLKVDGLVGPKTIACIRKYQASNALPTDGRVDPRGLTIQSLVDNFVQRLASRVTPLSAKYGRLPITTDSLFASTLAEGLSALSKRA